MAIARPVRVLGLAAIMMWCFFLYQVFKPGGSIKTPLGIPNNERDPLLDRELPSLTSLILSRLAISDLEYAHSNWRARRHITSRRPRLCAQRKPHRAHQRDTAGPRPK